jgi:predicted phage tail component-like protein
MSIQFDGTELMNASYTPRFAKHESSPDRDIEILELARDDGGILVSEKYKPKIITIQGILKASTRNGLDNLIDDFKELLSRKNKNLDIEHNGATRRYVAWAQKITIDRDYYHNLFVPYSVEFIVPEGVGKDTELTAGLHNVDADPTYAGSVQLLGSAVPKPKITLTIGSGWSDADGIQFENTDTNEILTINRSAGFTGADVLEIDCDEKTVELNNVEIPFVGVFPSFQIGANAIAIRAGDLVDQQFAPSVASINLLTDIFGNNWAAQSFTVPHTDLTYQGLYLYLKKSAADPPNPLVIEIQTDSAGKPSGSAVSNATFSLAVAGVSTDAGWILINSTNKFTLSANTRYWIVLKTTAGDASHYFEWFGVSGTNATYGRGNEAISSDAGTNWTDQPTYDCAFKLLYGGKAEASAPNLTLDIDYYKRWL